MVLFVNGISLSFLALLQIAEELHAAPILSSPPEKSSGGSIGRSHGER
jgi:hypothetical protein